MLAIKPLLLCCALFASACTREVIVEVTPQVPPDLLRPVPEPVLRGTTNAAVARAIIALRQGMAEANGKIVALAEIFEPEDGEPQ